MKDINNYKTNESEFLLSFNKLARLLECEVEEENIKKVLTTVLDNDNALAFYNNENSNQVSTIHKAKGKEFDLVFLFSSDFTRFDNLDNINKLYVAITRAKKQLIILNNTESSLLNYVNAQIKAINGEITNFYFLPTKS